MYTTGQQFTEGATVMNKKTLCILSLIPGLGHIAIQSRKKGYLLVALDLFLLAIIYAIPKAFQDTNILSPDFQDTSGFYRLGFAILFLWIPLAMWSMADVVEEASGK
jgi:hypothetical protein